jgi:hypothetical protein
MVSSTLRAAIATGYHVCPEKLRKEQGKEHGKDRFNPRTQAFDTGSVSSCDK